MNRSIARTLALAGLLILSLSACSSTADRTSGALEATGAWMRAVPAGSVGAVYLEIHNPTKEPQRLTAARFEDAVSTELHETVQDGDIMRMLPLEEGVLLEAGETAVFEPGGKHIMLMDLHRDMEIGAGETITLVFESGTELEVAVEVRDPLDLGD